MMLLHLLVVRTSMIALCWEKGIDKRLEDVGVDKEMFSSLRHYVKGFGDYGHHKGWPTRGKSNERQVIFGGDEN